MRSTSLFFLFIGLTGCVTHGVPCSATPTDPMCISDTGNGDAGDMGVDANVDVRLPCGAICTGMRSHCLVTGGTETCVGCTGDPDCSGTTSHCEPTSHTCVGCIQQSDCPASMAFCDPSHTCQPCAMSTQCSRLPATPVCSTGMCVACNTNDQTACPSHVCITSTSSCAPMGGATATCGTCTRDANCHTGQLCVPMTYTDPTITGAMPQPVGNRCLWRQDAAGMGAPRGDCFANERPYVRASMLTSVDGTSAMVCTLALSTCEAQAAFSMTDCTMAGTPADSLCQHGAIHDGVCRNVSGATNRCTVFCLSNDDCRMGSMCNTAAVPPVCGF